MKHKHAVADAVPNKSKKGKQKKPASAGETSILLISTKNLLLFSSSSIFYYPPGSCAFGVNPVRHSCSLVPFLSCLSAIFHVASFPYCGTIIVPCSTVPVTRGVPSLFLAVPVHCNAFPRPLHHCSSYLASLRWRLSLFVAALFPFTPAHFLHVPASSDVPCHSCLLRHGTFTFPFFLAPRSRSCSLRLLARYSPFLAPLDAILSVPCAFWRDCLRSSCLLARLSPFLVPLGVIVSVPCASWRNPIFSFCLLAQSSLFVLPLSTILSVLQARWCDPPHFWTTPRDAFLERYWIFFCFL